MGVCDGVDGVDGVVGKKGMKREGNEERRRWLTKGQRRTR